MTLDDSGSLASLGSANPRLPTVFPVEVSMTRLVEALRRPPDKLTLKFMALNNGYWTVKYFDRRLSIIDMNLDIPFRGKAELFRCTGYDGVYHFVPVNP